MPTCSRASVNTGTSMVGGVPGGSGICGIELLARRAMVAADCATSRFDSENNHDRNNAMVVVVVVLLVVVVLVVVVV